MLGMKSLIQNVNTKVENLCSNTKNVYFVNLFPHLADLQGDLKPEYHVGDDVHFTDEAYKIIGETVGEAIIKNSGNKGI
jgi:lysophospholipase L1-like esterase